MRDPPRIGVTLQRIADIWNRYPDLRLAQLLLNVPGTAGEIYNMEDDKLLQEIEAIYTRP